MPISGPASYISTTEAFLNHWTQANAALPPAQPLTMPGKPLGFDAPVLQATLQGLYDSLFTQVGVVQSSISDTDFAREDLFDQKTLLLDKLNQFNDKVRGNLPGTKYARRVPLAPSFGDSRSNFTTPMETAQNLWARINTDQALGSGLTLILREDYTEAQFAAAVAALRERYRELGRQEDDLGLEREERNDLQDRIYPILKQYRVLLPTFFPENSALVDSLPLLSPTGTRTPTPVVATGVWDAALQTAKLTWTESTDAELDRYEVRWSPGSEYHVDEESTLGTVSPESSREFQSTQGLATAGTLALFRVVVVLKTGHEAGSDTVKVQRP